MMSFAPLLDILPPAQRQLWPELAQVPRGFVLYGGTALALQLGHRASHDFDFFSSECFTPDELTRRVPLLRGGERLQSEPNTLTVVVPGGIPVHLSFFGGLEIGRVGTPQPAPDNGVLVADLLDLAATKMAAVQQRAESKDYRDIHALLHAGLTLPAMLAAARAVYGPSFNAAITLKALSWHEDGDLAALPNDLRDELVSAVVNVQDLPTLSRVSDVLC